MKKLKLTKAISSLLIAVSVLALNPIRVSAEWRENNAGWWYSEGNSYATGWRLIDGTWYYFYEGYYKKGYMAHNTLVGKYYLDSNGTWTQTVKYTPNEIKKENSDCIIVCKSGKEYDLASDEFEDYFIVNGEPCLGGYIGLNTLNIYDSQTHNVIDTVKLPGSISNTSTVYSQNNNEQMVSFVDKNLEAIIRNKINKPTGELYRSDVESINTLEIRDANISTLDGIENLTNLNGFSIYDNELYNISAISRLNNLEYLGIRSAKLKDPNYIINTLKGLKLKHISLLGNYFSYEDKQKLADAVPSAFTDYLTIHGGEYGW